MTANEEKYAYEGNEQQVDHVVERRDEDLHVRNVAVGGYKVPKSVIDKQLKRKTKIKKKPDDADLRKEN